VITASASKQVALAGNPNTGKTTLFNRLTGASARVGNYPGVTVERESGRIELDHGSFAARVELVDVPGTYSLSARSREEQLAIQAICGLHPLERPDAVLLVVDATQLTRNLYLALQVIETDVPVVIALNMVDMLTARGLEVDVAGLERALGVPVVPTSANRGTGLEALRRALARVLREPASARPGPHWMPATPELQGDVRAVAGAMPDAWHHGEARRRDALALWALLSLDEADEFAGVPDELRARVLERRRLASAQGRDIESEIIQGRYAWIDAHAAGFVRERSRPQLTRTDRVDRVLLHPFAGFVIFLAAMGVVFQSLFSWADPAVGRIEDAVGALKRVALDVLPAGLVTDFVADALIEGVGSVLVFVPQIVMLFVFIGVMEDSGYMARVAFLMDRVMKAIGLHGRAFVPMMSGFACAVPAILATRTMERQRDRLLTMMVVPLMTCSARLPVYSLLIGALFPPSDVFGVLPVQGLLMVAMYVFSTLIALVAAAVLGRTIIRGRGLPLLIEMPPYRMPHARSLASTVWRRVRTFLTEAGTVILACTVVMWALLSFPSSGEIERRYDERRGRAIAESGADELAREARLRELDAQQASESLRASFGGRIGHAIEPAIAPLGFDWKIGIGLLGAFAAREVFVSTMGVVYGIGDEADESSVGLRERIRNEAHADGRPVYSPLVGLSLMVFFAIACQCMSTLAVVKRETLSWRWPSFLFAYTLALAWVASFAVYQGGRALGF
jgi:ferrous iron transport protein B